MKKRIQTLLLFLLASCFATVAVAQSRQVSGTVKDKQGAPISGATVIEKGTTNGTTTDDAGVFHLSVAGANSVIVISAINFVNQEITVGQQTNLDVALEKGSGNLDEVVVTALGIKRQKKSLGYAVQEIKGTELSDARETNLANALTGKVAGLQVVRSSNGAGGSSKIVLRGFTSVSGSNQPLIVVDGIPIDNFTGTTENGYWGAGFDRGNGLGDINAEDIESMSVLKGPSAAALYGSRAGNGVILITTKSGRKSNGLGINFTMNQGIENIFIKPEIQNSFGQGDQKIYDRTSQLSWGPKAEGQDVTKWDGSTAPLTTSHDNVDNFLRAGTTQSYNLSFQQQYGSTAIYTSLGRWIDKSIIPNNKLERTNLSTRAVSKFGKNNRWTTDMKISYNNTSGFNRPINGRDVSNVFTLYTLPRSMNINDFKTARNEDGQMVWYEGAPGWQNNPHWNTHYNLNTDVRDRFILNGSVKYAFNDWLDAEVKAGGDIYTTSTQRKVFAGSNRANEYSEGKQTFFETNYSTLITAKKDDLIGKFGGVVTVGGNLMHTKSSFISIGTGQLEVPDVFSLTNGINPPSIGQSFYEKKINSAYGTVGVNYDGFVYLDMTFRNDWSSALSKANRSYFYPSFSLSYVFTDMMASLGGSTPSWLSYLKLRASHASVGNDLGAFMLYNGFNIGRGPNGNTTASRNSVLRDENVVSELIKNLEFGIESRFFNNRLGIDFTWYKSNATNQLIGIPMDPLSGYSSKMINAGNIQNKGIELMVDFRALSNPKSLSWNITANYSRNENRIIDMASDIGVNRYDLGAFDDLFIRANTGGLYGDIFGTKLLRVEDQSSPFFGELLLNSAGLPQRTSELFLLGNQQAKGLIGVTNTFNYRNFGFSFLVDGRIGGEMFSASNVGLQRFGVAAVTAPGGERPDLVVPGVIQDGSGGYTKNSVTVTQQQYWNQLSTLNNLGVGEAYIYDATNIRLRNVQLTYNFSKSLLSKTAFQSARIALSCNNVWMIKSHMLGIDPESVFATGSNAVGFENGAFPTMRSFLLSVNVGF
ncbi:SusC/RagA family TonB-linked outer membrane protein [Flavihumibacter sp. CACIAM 22H1]|uniref:SusC/RagA family TonB-linked outer membrane protein n=1 Tax=Flavihumibacter sp. CACIAM 22H1 TaxID=1812911 RepID=UPI0007A87289|nr:SusC/RagA family TonB-linked outer membrane protein [Flavihumibacter sp. CACIAM 22H1]KYP14472.1 MAG: SusC/RagA family protein [Flavihumibacter sp. CACIAM 22H1]